MKVLGVSTIFMMQFTIMDYHESLESTMNLSSIIEI